MKTLLPLLLIGAIAFLAYQNHEKQQTLQRIANEAEQAEVSRKLADFKEQVRKAEAEANKVASERDGVKEQLDAALAERDDARQQVVAANAEIGRLTATTPKPVSWFEKRLNSATKLDAPPTTTTPRRYYIVPAPATPYPQ